jgi:hypothetical protein
MNLITRPGHIPAFFIDFLRAFWGGECTIIMDADISNGLDLTGAG